MRIDNASHTNTTNQSQLTQTQIQRSTVLLQFRLSGPLVSIFIPFYNQKNRLSFISKVINLFIISNIIFLLMSSSPPHDSSPRRKIPLRTYKLLPNIISTINQSQETVNKIHFLRQKFDGQKMQKGLLIFKSKNYNMCLSDAVFVFEKSKKSPQRSPVRHAIKHKSLQRSKQRPRVKQNSNECLLMNKIKFRIQMKSRGHERVSKHYFEENPRQRRDIETSQNRRKIDLEAEIKAWETPREQFSFTDFF